MADLDLALSQVDGIRAFVTFSANLALPPFPLPQDAVRAAGLDPSIWHGLGMVGLWASIDAFVERRAPNRGGTLPARIRGCTSPGQQRLIGELDDMRHLFAHNFGGIADSLYFSRSRHVLREGVSYQLASGAKFDGHELTLDVDDLSYYGAETRLLLVDLGAKLP